MGAKSVNLIHKQMQTLECPFTWEMNGISKEYDVEYHLNDDEELFPLLQLMRHLMTVYVNIKARAEFKDEVLKMLVKCDEIMNTLKENNHPEISDSIVEYVLQSTKCFVYKQLNLPKKLEQVFSEIKKDWKMSNKERSTLIACRSICWSKYHRIGASEAERFIRDAIRENPNCELWYFVLGKNLRRMRRDSSIAAKPSKEEIDSFQKAYTMSTSNPAFGVYLAQMYREMWKARDAKKIYYNIFEQNPTSTTILLRLALGFLRLKVYMKAKECLDKVEAVSPKHSMYLHYRGIYLLNHKNYKEAAELLKEASKDNNIPAEKQYLDCVVMLDKSFDVVQYFHNMVVKYSHFPEDQSQPLLLDLALAYWLKKRDVSNAIKYFAMAIEINPDAKCITNHLSSQALPIKENNIYNLLIRDVLPIVLKRDGKFNKACITEAEELQIQCDKYFARNFAKTLNSFSKFVVKN